MKIKVLELFSGIGALSKALERLEIEHEIVDAVEIDKYAVKSFNAIHNTNFEPQDICEWDKNIEVDLIMHGSPCQDFGLAGKQAGGDKDSGTRSSLMYETIRIVKKLKPKYVIWENVKNLLSKKHRHNFDAYLEIMEQLGYTNYYQVLNAKDYGIPQNRERVFTVSILGSENYEFPKGEECENKINRKYGLYGQVTRWGVYDENGLAPTITASMGMGGGHVPMIDNFEFPPKQELKLRLKDMLEDEVDEKYYLSDVQIKRIETTTYNVEKTRIQKKEWCDTLLARDWKDPKCVEIKSKCKRLQALIEKTEFEEGKVLNMDLYNQTTNENISQCLTEPHHNTQRLFDGLRIRKITPKEAWRLMGFDDEDYEKASQFNSNTQLYKQAGNSIVVNVLEAILINLLK